MLYWIKTEIYLITTPKSSYLYWNEIKDLILEKKWYIDLIRKNEKGLIVKCDPKIIKDLKDHLSWKPEIRKRLR